MTSTLRGGQYELLGILGEGSQGTTYDALDKPNNRALAIKRFDVRGARSWKDVELAEREARVLATLDHPLLPRYVEHFEENGALYLVMEKVPGETLESLRRRVGRLPEDEVRRFLACADRALTYMHGRGQPVVHRDIKPKNVIRRPDGSYVFVDFGAVSEQLRRRGGSTVAGTIGYMAPEQLQGRALAQTDVYGVGATALALLAGADPEELPHQGLRLDVRAALQPLGNTVSPSLVRSLELMLEPDPDRRAASLAFALERAWAAEPTSDAGLSTPVSNEDAIVRSVRKLLWTLWGLSWIITPIILAKHYSRPDMVPVVMFTSLAALIVLGWHKGAFLRILIRMFVSDRSDQPAAMRQRVDIGADPRVRVQASDHRVQTTSNGAYGQTEIDRFEPPVSSQQARRAMTPPAN
jgi:serine/threonine protein kinase